MSALPPAPPHIGKRRADADGLDFDGLRAAGIALLQEMCGDAWTDYNLHDPGVTILEQLCYALSDLVYRGGFSCEEFLFGSDGRIDARAQALLPAETVLPCRPLTCTDYARLFADAIPEIRKVWVEPDADARVPGLYRIHVQLAETTAPAAQVEPAVLARIAALYAANRNLGEDLGRVEIVAEEAYRLAGRIEVERGCIAADVLAEIYFACAVAISPPIPQQPYDSVAERELDELLDGPFCANGYIDAQALRNRRGVTLSELVCLVGAVDGVVRVDQLQLIDSQGKACEAACGDVAARRMPELARPASALEQALRLHSSGHPRSVDHAEFLARLEQLDFAAASRRRAGGVGSEPLSPLPVGSAPGFAAYTSVQEHFPQIYGLGQQGIPESAPRARKAQAKQLKAYLLLFDQIIANGMQGIQEIRKLYSLDEHVERSYFHQLLGRQHLADADSLYALPLPDVDAGLAAIVATLDRFGERRGRFLDYLLALHGEKFTQHSLRAFLAQPGKEVEGALLASKIGLLRELATLNGARMSAGGVAADGSETASSFARKLALLLGLPAPPAAGLSAAFASHGLRVVDDQAFRADAGLEFATLPPAGEPASSLAGEEAVALPAADLAALVATAPAASFLAQGIVCPALLAAGNDPAHYRIVDDGEAVRLYFALPGDDSLCLLSTHADRRAALLAANRLLRFFDALQQPSLGFHLLEHVLLRPRDEAAWSSDCVDSAAADDSFCHFRVSLLFPAWPPRFADAGFRKLVAETAHTCSPAHLCFDIFWLDVDAMSRFEDLQRRWRELRRAPPAAAATTDLAAVAAALREFVQSCAAQVYGNRWL